MRDILTILINFVLWITYIFMGAWSISEAVQEFKKNQYFRFGLDVMLALWWAFHLLIQLDGGLI